MSFALVVQCVCAAAAPASDASERLDTNYSRASSLFRTTTLASEAKFYNLIGVDFDGARLTILRDFQKQTQVQVLHAQDAEFTETYLEVSFATPSFGAPTEELSDGSTVTRAKVDSYLIKISAEEFAELMSALHSIEKQPAVSSSDRSSDRGCLHPAGFYFESVKAEGRVLVSRSGCDNDFRAVVLQTAPLFDFAVRKIPTALQDFEFARSLFAEIRKKKKSDY